VSFLLLFNLSMRIIVVVGVHVVAIVLLMETPPPARISGQKDIQMEVQILTVTASTTPLQVSDSTPLSPDIPVFESSEPKDQMRLDSPFVEKRILTMSSETSWTLTGSAEVEIRDPSDEHVEINQTRLIETPKSKAKPKSVNPPTAKQITVAATTSQATQVKKNSEILGVESLAPDLQPFVGVRFDADYLHNPAPAYPATSRRLKEQGAVLIFVQVNERGDPVSVQLKQSSGHERLDQAALEAVRLWRFVPAKRGQTPIAASVIVPIHFKR
jgi:TonB family protein